MKGREDIASLVFPAFQRPSGGPRPIDGPWARLRTLLGARAGWKPLATSLAGLLVVLAACSTHAKPAPNAPSGDTSNTPGVGVTATAPALFDDRLPAPAQATEHTPAPWKFDVKHYEISVDVRPEEKALNCIATIYVDDAADGVAAIEFDAVGMEIDSVRLIGMSPDPKSDVQLPFGYDGRKLRIELPEPHRTGTSRVIFIAYRTRPIRGVYFNDGDPPQVYSQSEMEDARYWFPCHDFPDDRATSTVQVCVPAGWHVIGAGKGTAGSSPSPEVRYPWIYRLDVPHVSYLISMTAGQYEVIDEQGVVPLQYVVEKRDAPYAAANFRKTDAVLRFFGDYTGLPYPYPKYSQTLVRNFMYGGMENISATTLTDHTIHPPDWEPAHDSTSLVAHEAAHQWFGDWITCSDWSCNWLNEGFATYFDLLFTEKDEGRDMFLWRLRGEREGAFGAMNAERRAVISNRWADPDEMFDGHAYAGGATRLHMLRHLLGDEQFKGAIRHYVKKCGLSCVTTDDFEHAVEEFTGQDLKWFFDQWFRRVNYALPIAVSWKPAAGRAAAVVTVEQQRGLANDAPLCRVPLDLEFVLPSGESCRRRLDITKRTEEFTLDLPAVPTRLRADPDTALLATIEVESSLDEWIADLASDPNPALRSEAAVALGAIVRDDKNAHVNKDKTPADRDKSYAALVGAFASEKFAPFRASLAGYVALRKDDASAAVLIDAMNKDTDLRVRLAASDTLHGFAGNA